MPRGDRTGPDGLGAMTGRRLGFCNGYDSPGFTKCSAGFGRGMAYGRGGGYGYGYGRGFGRRAEPVPYPPEARDDKNDELRTLKDQARQMEENLNVLNARIGELEK